MSCLSKRKARARALEKRKPILPYSPRVERARPLQFHDSGVRARRADVRQLRANGAASFLRRSPDAPGHAARKRCRKDGNRERVEAGFREGYGRASPRLFHSFSANGWFRVRFRQILVQSRPTFAILSHCVSSDTYARWAFPSPNQQTWLRFTIRRCWVTDRSMEQRNPACSPCIERFL